MGGQRVLERGAKQPAAARLARALPHATARLPRASRVLTRPRGHRHAGRGACPALPPPVRRSRAAPLALLSTRIRPVRSSRYRRHFLLAKQVNIFMLRHRII